MPNTKAWWTVCPMCGQRKKMRDKLRADNLASTHNLQRHGGLRIAFSEQSEK